MKKRVFGVAAVVLFFLCVILGIQASGANSVTLDGNLLEYDLGVGELQHSRGTTVEYRMQGVLGVPQGTDCPIIVLVHGAHPIEEAAKDRYDTGFEYLAQALAEDGNLVISLNVGMNYSYESGEPNGNERTKQIIAQQLMRLKEALDGDDSVYGYDIAGKGDFGQLYFMGHSRGGMDVIEAVEDTVPELDLPGVKVRGIVSVAPSLYKVFETGYPNVPIGIIMPQMDGDVISLDGNDIYESLLEDENYTAATELIYLKRANHGYFNTQLTQPDLMHGQEELEQLLAPEQQRDFLVRYMKDFIVSVRDEGETPYARRTSVPTTLYDCDVLLRVRPQQSVVLYSAVSNTAAAVQDAAVEDVIYSYLVPQNTAGYFRMPGASAFTAYSLARIKWDAQGGAVAVPIEGETAGIRYIDFEMAIDSTDAANQSGQSLALQFTDAGGDSQKLSVSQSEGALLWQEGEFLEFPGWEEGEINYEYSNFTPLVTLRVDCAQLSGIDASHIREITMLFDDGRAGSLMLRSISAVYDDGHN